MPDGPYPNSSHAQLWRAIAEETVVSSVLLFAGMPMSSVGSPAAQRPPQVTSGGYYSSLT